ncbi:MAG: MBOAT family protein, partial [Solobacterium sp.]|nr:MBOAT family protein [Solobacterium sp.]
SYWFRDYVYIPLGGNRKGLPRQLVNIIIVWFLTGLWHGAAWNFILWGMFYGFLLILEKLFLLKHLQKAPRFLQHSYTMAAVLIA